MPVVDKFKIGDKVRTKARNSTANYNWTNMIGIIESIFEDSVRLKLDHTFMGHNFMDFKIFYWDFELCQKDWDQ